MEEVGGTPEGTREDGFTGVQRNIHQKETWPQYKVAESNLNHSRYVSTEYQIFGLIEKQYPGWLNSTNKNQISLTIQIPFWVSFDFNVAYSSRWGYSLIKTLKLKKFSKVFWEFVRMKKTSKTRDAGGEEQWRSILTSFRDTATRSNGFKVIRTRTRSISARVASIKDWLCLFTGAAPSGLGSTGNNTEVGSIWVLSILWDTDVWGFCFDGCFVMG